MYGSNAEIRDAIGQLRAMQALLHRRELALIAEYDRREAWREDGCTSMTAWLAYLLNVSHPSAADDVRIARAIGDLPAIADAYSSGELSRDHLRALTRFATAETDASLAAEAGIHSAAHVYRMAARARPVPIEDERAAHDARSLKLHSDGRLMHLLGRLPVADGARVAKALERIVVQTEPEKDTALEQRMADALVELSSARLAEDHDSDRATVALHVPASVIAGGDGVAELEDGEIVAAETARRLACDCRWYIVVDGPDGSPIGVGRTTRQVPAWLLRELKRRDLGCVFPGCGRRRWVNAHHIVPWSEGGATDLANLVLLCGTHHRLVHEGGARLSLDVDGRARFALPNGRVVDGTRPPGLRPELRRRLRGQRASRQPALLDTG